MEDVKATDADIASAPVDLSGINPVHWAEARERVQILREWCSTGRHTRAQAEMAAERMGTTIKHFYRLVSTWKKYRDARRVSGHAVKKGQARGPRTMDRRTREILGEVVAELGARARHGDVVAEVTKRCAVANRQTPSAGMVHYALMQARQSPSTADQSEGILVAAVKCLHR